MIRERGRDHLTGAARGAGYRLVVDAFVESGDRARVATWRLDLKKNGDGEWGIAGLKRLSGVDNVYRLSINSTRQFKASHFKLRSEDFDLTLTEGSVFTIDTDQGVTGFILLGRGDLRFSPTPDTEKGQIRIFTGSDTLESRFDAAYVRVGAVDMHADVAQLVERPIDPRELRRAEQLFREESVKTFGLALGDLSSDSWSLLPAAGDFLAEVRTRRFDTLTYSRARSESEDVSLFERRHQRKIAAYASVEKVASSRTLLQRRRPRRVRHPRSRHRPGRRSRATVDRGARHGPVGNPGAVHQPDHHGAGRIADRALRRQRRVRLAVQRAREEPEYVARQPADASDARHPNHPEDRIWRPVDPAEAGPRNTGARSTSLGAGMRISTWLRKHRTELSLQQPQLLVPAGADQRLLDGDHADFHTGHAQLRRNG